MCGSCDAKTVSAIKLLFSNVVQFVGPVSCSVIVLLVDDGCGCGSGLSNCDCPLNGGFDCATGSSGSFVICVVSEATPVICSFAGTALQA